MAETSLNLATEVILNFCMRYVQYTSDPCNRHLSLEFFRWQQVCVYVCKSGKHLCNDVLSFIIVECVQRLLYVLLYCQFVDTFIVNNIYPYLMLILFHFQCWERMTRLLGEKTRSNEDHTKMLFKLLCLRSETVRLPPCVVASILGGDLIVFVCCDLV